MNSKHCDNSQNDHEFVESSLINLEQHSDVLLSDMNNLIQKLFQMVHQLQRNCRQVLSHRSCPSNDNTSHEVQKMNEAAPTEEVKEDNIAQVENDSIFDKLNDFVSGHNEDRPANRQIDGDAVIRCTRDNDIDYTDFKDLNRNFKRYGIPAGVVRKLWRFLNPVGMNENDQDDENVVIIPVGSYIYVPSEYEHILFEDNGIDESIDLEIGENLSVPDDWSDGD